MDQNRIIILLTRRLAREATPEELSELEELFKNNPDAVYYEQAFKEIWQNDLIKDDQHTADAFAKHQLKFSDDFNSPLPAVHSADAEFVAESEGRRSRYHGFKLLSFMAAAVVLLVVGAGLYKQWSDAENNSFIEITAGKGIRKMILLPDSSQVWLNSESKLRYSKNLTSNDNRVVTLSGEGFFDIKKDKEHPFIIHTDKFAIRVLGTAFNIRAYANEQKREATLIRGLIELSLNDQPKQKILLRPNEKLALSDTRETERGQLARKGENRTVFIETIVPVQVQDTSYIEETAWVSNKLVFSNASLQELVPKLESWFNVKIVLKNKKTASYRFTGVFENENVAQALTAMKLIRSFDFKIIENEVIIN
ncbi:FecR family protein [Pedobacter sp. AW31-3R]|uniref:FecR family protein n=1 Tax=Pedobacter sp. AW31-3R TaxID=3445781 RepID=UPI003FA11241